ncbi:MAG: hypothetical protein WKF41_17120 [Gaiellaceae bacterium]
MKRVAGVDEVGGVADVLIAEEPGLQALDVGSAMLSDFLFCCGDHCRKDVDGDDSPAHRRRRESERPRSGAEIDQRRAFVEAEAAQQRHLLFHIGVETRLAVVSRDVTGIAMSFAGVSELVEQSQCPVHAGRDYRRAGSAFIAPPPLFDPIRKERESVPDAEGGRQVRSG